VLILTTDLILLFLSKHAHISTTKFPTNRWDPFTCFMYYARLHQFFFLIRRRLAQNTSFFMSLSAAMGNSFFHDGWNYWIPPSSYFLTFSLSCFCSQGDSGFLLLPIFHRSSKLATTVHTGSETRQSDLILSPAVFRWIIQCF